MAFTDKVILVIFQNLIYFAFFSYLNMIIPTKLAFISLKLFEVNVQMGLKLISTISLK